MPRKAKVKIEEGKPAEQGPDKPTSAEEIAEAERFVEEILSVQKFLHAYDINRTSNLDTLLARAKATLEEKKRV